MKLLRWISLLACCSTLFAADGLPIEMIKRSEPLDYAKEVFPFLNRNCLPCHNSTKAKSKLNMETPQLMMQGSENGPVIIPGKAEESFLFILAAHRDEDPDLNMPPAPNKANAVNLTPEELGLLKLWIDQGAKGLAPSQINRPLDWRPVASKVQPIIAVDMDPVGHYVACGRGNDVHIYGLQTGRQVARLPQVHRDLVQAIAFSPNNTLATAGFKQVRIWEPQSMEGGMEIELPETLTASASSADGKWCILGDAGGHIACWQVEGTAPLNWKQIHQGPVTAIHILSNQDHVLTASMDQTVRLLDRTSLSESWKLEPGYPITAALLVNEDKQVALGGPFNEIKLYDIGSTNRNPAVTFTGHGQPITHLVGLPGDSQQFLAADASGQVKHWQMEGAKNIRTVNAGAPLQNLSLSPDGKLFCTTHTDRPAKLWLTDNGNAVKDLNGNIQLTWELERQERGQKVAQKRKTHFENKEKVADKKLQDETKKLKEAEEALPKVQQDKDAKEKSEAEKKPSHDTALALVKQREEEELKQIEEQKGVVLNAGEAHAKLMQESGAILPAAQELKKQKDAMVQTKQAAVKSAEEQVKKTETEQARLLDEARKLAEAAKTKLEQVQKEIAALDPAAVEEKKAKEQAAQQHQQALNTAQKQVKQREAEQVRVMDDVRKHLEAEKVSLQVAMKDAEKILPEAQAAKAEKDKAVQEKKNELEAATKLVEQLEKGDGKELAAAKNAAKKPQEEFEKANKDADEARSSLNSAKFNIEAAQRILARSNDELASAKTAMVAGDQILTAANTSLETARKSSTDFKPQPGEATFLTPNELLICDHGTSLQEWTSEGTALDAYPIAPSRITHLSALDAQRVLLGSEDKKVRIQHIAPAWKPGRTFTNFSDRVTALDFSPDGKWLATGSGEPSRKGSLDIWNVKDGAQVLSIEEAHADTILGLAFSPDGTLIATASPDRLVKIWSLPDGKLLRTLEGHTDYVLSVAWRADGLELASGGADKVVKRWQVEDGKQVETMKEYEQEVTAVSYLGTESNLVSASGDQTVRIDKTRLGNVNAFMQIATTSLNGKYIAAGGEDGVLKVWSSDRKLIHEFKPE
ncbi:MAG: WD40 repeat protein [Candidatus Omnitrophota bacterium]|jgi:WD40 repeat protein